MTIEYRNVILDPASLNELKQLAELLEKYKDHISFECCNNCGAHPVYHVFDHTDAKCYTPHISLYSDPDILLRWEEEETWEDEEDEEDWDQYRNDRQKGE